MNYFLLARSYNTLSSTHEIRGTLAAFYGKRFDNLNRRELAQKINNALIKNYYGEQILKFRLAKEFKSKKYIGAFEVPVRSSRIDFLVINGETKSFEIKSKIDTLNRLKKQIEDYGDVFEYNNVVTDKIHLEKLIQILPDYYGIWHYENSRKIEFRQAHISPLLSPEAQLSLFNKTELIKSFSSYNHKEILSRFNTQEINRLFKSMLKDRYRQRWNFICNHWNKILAIDLQFFFNTNVNPELVYDVDVKH